MDEIFKRILDALKGADFWIALLFLATGIICLRWIGTTKKGEKKVLRRQISFAFILAVLAVAAILMNHFFFEHELVFSKNLTGIQVMRIEGDDATNSLQGALVDKLNAELQKESVGQPIEVHEGRETIDQSGGIRHAHARSIGQSLNAKLVIWGRKIGDKTFNPRITVVNAFKASTKENERTYDAQNITDLRVPRELADEPFYLIHFTAGQFSLDLTRPSFLKAA